MGLVVDVRAHALLLPEGDVPDLGARLAAMDEAGVDVQVVSAAPGHLPEAHGRRLTGEATAVRNERIASLVRRAPDRLVGVGAVALRHPGAAADQLRRAVDDHDFRGVQITPGRPPGDLAHPDLDPFWAMAALLGTVVFVRPAGSRPVGPTATGLADVLSRFPGLVVCSTPQSAAGGPNPGTRRWYVDSAVPDRGELRRLVAAAGPQHVLRASGYPFTDPAPLSELELAPAERNMIDGGTASRLLRLGAFDRNR